MRTLTLTKHHGLGNDFLVFVDHNDEFGDDHAAMARALCDRHRGIGADGLIRLGPYLRMHLHNADGSRAEMSGNGIRCLAQAIVDHGLTDETEFEIETDAGTKWVRIGEPHAASGLGMFTREITVDMGPARIVESTAGERAVVDMGNPHLVLPDEGQDLLALGAQHPEVNVELISTTGNGDLAMRVHERGVGVTQACGTGSCASAAAAHAWGWVGTAATVHNPGGAVSVELKDETVFLTGPATFIARVDVLWPGEPSERP
ncbi:MAG TPA: diaminopimelate epimerase [Acidimicrobiales bacterium]|jgi:diaminopimelate epimerase|nr:diaminopimelate epimerase [Acidimicrobiales bacterium]